MNHERYQELVHLFMDEGLDDTRSAEMFGHLSNCKECRNLLHSSLQIRSYYQQNEREEVSPSLDQRILATTYKMRIRNAQVRRWNPFTPLWATRILIPLPAAASIAVLILIGSLLFSPLLFEGTKTKNETQIEMIPKLPPELQLQFRLLK